MKQITTNDFDWTVSATQKTAFTTLWPRGLKPTLENALRARDAGLSLICAARNLLRDKYLKAFFRTADASRRRYRETLGPHIARLSELRRTHDRPGFKLAEIQFEDHKRERWAVYQEEIALTLVLNFRKQEGLQ